MNDTFSSVALIMAIVVVAATSAFLGNYNLGLALLIIGIFAAVSIAYVIGYFAHKNDVRITK